MSNTAVNDTSNHLQDDSQITEEMIRARAYQLFEEQICQDGHAEYNWQQAENDVLSQQTENQSENIDV